MSNGEKGKIFQGGKDRETAGGTQCHMQEKENSRAHRQKKVVQPELIKSAGNY